MKHKVINYIAIACMFLIYTACIGPALVQKKENKALPSSYNNKQDTLNSATINWKDFFNDANLKNLIDEALSKNQELNITLQEIVIAQNEIRTRKGAYLPFVGFGTGAGVEKVGRYTSQGASDDVNEITPGKKVPVALGNFAFGFNASWEIDIWRKLRNSKKSAVLAYLSTINGKNFMVTNLISEIANSYYELLAFDNQLDILKKNIELQKNALEIVKYEKIAARVTELAVRKFEAEVLKNQSHQYYIMQQIIETENRINFLIGRFPQPIVRDDQAFLNLIPDTVYNGIPSQLLFNRPDIMQAEQQLSAAKLNIKIAKAEFYPSLTLRAGIGYGAFNPAYLIQAPQSLLYALAGDLMAPLINRNAIKANYYNANAKQVQAIYNYERNILKAHIEVINQLSNISNLKNSYDLKDKQVSALTESYNISTILFKSARADYMEVLLTQRDALEAKFELVETKMQQMKARVNMYKALGGGWK